MNVIIKQILTPEPAIRCPPDLPALFSDIIASPEVLSIDGNDANIAVKYRFMI